MAAIERLTMTLPSNAWPPPSRTRWQAAITPRPARWCARPSATGRWSVLCLRELEALKAEIDRARRRRRRPRQDVRCRPHHPTGEDAIGRPLLLRANQAAETDLAQIWFHIASEASAETASRFVAAIESGVRAALPVSAVGCAAAAPRTRTPRDLSRALRDLLHADPGRRGDRPRSPWRARRGGDWRRRRLRCLTDRNPPAPTRSGGRWPPLRRLPGSVPR